MLLALMVAISTSAASAQTVCADNAEIVAACFELRGRLSFWNGTPTARIWPVGTRRMLGVHGDALPQEIRSLMTTFDTELWGDFTVCPFTQEQPGKMQMVCIESWRNVTTRERKAR